MNLSLIGYCFSHMLSWTFPLSWDLFHAGATMQQLVTPGLMQGVAVGVVFKGSNQHMYYASSEMLQFCQFQRISKEKKKEKKKI